MTPPPRRRHRDDRRYPREIYPGLPRRAFARFPADAKLDRTLNWYSHDLTDWTPSVCFMVRFLYELCFVVVCYGILWRLGCHASAACTKWLLVGRQRAGVFPIWESKIGYRNALWQSAVPFSFSKVWCPPDIGGPNPLPPFVYQWYRFPESVRYSRGFVRMEVAVCSRSGRR